MRLRSLSRPRRRAQGTQNDNESWTDERTHTTKTDSNSSDARSIKHWDAIVNALRRYMYELCVFPRTRANLWDCITFLPRWHDFRKDSLYKIPIHKQIKHMFNVQARIWLFLMALPFLITSFGGGKWEKWKGIITRRLNATCVYTGQRNEFFISLSPVFRIHHLHSKNERVEQRREITTKNPKDCPTNSFEQKYITNIIVCWAFSGN